MKRYAVKKVKFEYPTSLMFISFLLLVLMQNPSIESAPVSFARQFADSNEFKYENYDNLILLTHNIDSLEQAKLKARYPNPFGSTMESNSAIIMSRDGSFVNITLKDAAGEPLATFMWNDVPSGVYKFRWWKQFENIPSGVYYVVVQTKDETTIDRAIIVR